MLLVFFAGIVAGFLMCAPVGPMAALAMLKLGEGKRRDAFLVALGVCIADMILAVFSLGLLYVPMPVKFPAWLGIGLAATVIAAVGVLVYSKADAEVSPTKGLKGFWSAVVLSLIFPGNILAYLALFGGVLPALGLGPLQELGVLDELVLLFGTGLGMGLGWTVFLLTIQWVVGHFGRLPKTLRPLMAKGIGVVLMVVAVGLVVKYLMN